MAQYMHMVCFNKNYRLMRSIILLAIIFGTISCNFKNDKVQEIILDNQELIEMFKSDQADRTQHIDRILDKKMIA